MEIKKGIIKINPFRFHPVILYACGEKVFKWNKLVDNIISIEVTPKHRKYALDNMGHEVEFTINKKDQAIISTPKSKNKL